ncbi:hypothetical protein L0244_33175, partial [bacterium]|nr:hypothetical protein [bacterium]
GEFVSSEDTVSLMRATKVYLKSYGRPVGFYVDRDSIYKTNRQATLEEELKDQQPLTQFARVMEELNIRLTFAYSPQAKGRVERSFRTHQERLVNELTLQDISDIEKANNFLWTRYIPAHNKKFSVAPLNPADAHRRMLRSQNLDQILSFRFERTLLNDFTLRFENSFYQILPTNGSSPKPKDKVFFEIRLDKSIHLRFKNRYLRFKKILKAKPLPDLPKQRRKPPVPAKNHPWRNFRIHSEEELFEKARQQSSFEEGFD